tara:strand:+ start:465 stop:890 length:426 start_codon:yes stop_codon:yes gene_type:complete
MSDLILEAGGTLAFAFHVLFMLFNVFIIVQFYFSKSFYDSFSTEEPKIVFRGPFGAVFIAILIMSILLTFDVTGNTYDENVVQYKFWYSFLFMLMAIALISALLRYFNIVSNYGVTPNIRVIMFPLIGLIIILLRTFTEAY